MASPSRRPAKGMIGDHTRWETVEEDAETHSVRAQLAIYQIYFLFL